MGYVDGMNLYLYLQSAPIGLQDPFGLAATTQPTAQPSDPSVGGFSMKDSGLESGDWAQDRNYVRVQHHIFIDASFAGPHVENIVYRQRVRGTIYVDEKPLKTPVPYDKWNEDLALDNQGWFALGHREWSRILQTTSICLIGRMDGGITVRTLQGFQFAKGSATECGSIFTS